MIKLLVAELNAERELKKWMNDTDEDDCDDEMTKDMLYSLYQQGAFEIKDSFPLADDNKFITNSSDILRNSQSCAGANGGVEFIEFASHRTPLAHTENE